MHRVYEVKPQRSPKHLQSYLKHKLEDQAELDQSETRKLRQSEASLFASSRPYLSSGKLMASPQSHRLPGGQPSSKGFMNVYQQSPSTSPLRSLERKNPEKRELRAQLITEGLKKLKADREQRRHQGNENQSPNRQHLASRNTPSRSIKKTPSPIASKNGLLKQNERSRKTGYSALFANANSPDEEVTNQRRKSPQNTLRNASKLSHNREHYEELTANSRLRIAQSRLTTDQNSECSDYSHSGRSQGRSSKSGSLVKNRGLSMTRDDSIERKLDTYMKNRKVASRTAVRLNSSTLFNLDTILWKVTTTHHVTSVQPVRPRHQTCAGHLQRVPRHRSPAPLGL